MESKFSSKSPEKKSNKYNKKTKRLRKSSQKNRISCHNKYIKNPSITRFNEESIFIYDNDMAEEYLSTIKDKNLIKLNQKEVDIIQYLVDKISIEKVIFKYQNIIFIDKSLANDLNEHFKIEKTNDPLKSFLIEEIKNNKNHNDFTLRKLSKKYNELTGKKASRTTINLCLKKKLGFRYLKSTIKTNKLLEPKSILNSFAFIKIISRCIKLKYTIIYCDESCLQNNNNNYYFWRYPNEELYGDIGQKKRLNLIMAINDEKVLYYEINKNSTNEESFYAFMEKLNDVIKNEKIYPCVLVLDNLSCHKTEKLIEFYSTNKINVIFNTPYLSTFNSIELSFRNLKRHLYTNIYESIEKIEEEAKNYLKNKSFNDGIRENFKETLLEYHSFNLNYKQIDINTLTFLKFF